jgi:hypothetical protein
MAMAKAKADGGSRTIFFEVEMGETVRERFQTEAELRAAVTGNQLRLFLQPQVNAQGVQVGAEALVRWQHPVRGLLPPGLFVPLAELEMRVQHWPSDDLEEIDGIGPMLSILLNDIGVFYFWQMAEWTDREIDWVEGKLMRFRGRIRRDDWVGHARVLAQATTAAKRPNQVRAKRAGGL